MCRDIDHGGRRCPGDTSAARAARKRNQKVRARNGAVGSRVSPRNVADTHVSAATTDQTTEPTYEEVLEKHKARIYHLMDTIRQERSTTPYDMMSGQMLPKTIELGQAIHEYACDLAGCGIDELQQEIAKKTSMVSIFAGSYRRTRDLTRWRNQQLSPTDVLSEDIIQNLSDHGIDTSRLTIEKLLNVIQKALEKQEDELVELKQRRRSAYIDALASLGVSMGSDQPVKVSEHVSHNKQCIEMLQEAVRSMPTAWIKNSDNADTELWVKKTTGRASFGDESVVESVESMKSRGANKARMNMVVARKIADDAQTFWERCYGEDHPVARRSRARITPQDIKRGYYEDDNGLRFSLAEFIDKGITGNVDIELPIKMKSYWYDGSHIPKPPRGYRLAGVNGSEAYYYAPHGMREKDLQVFSGATELVKTHTLTISGTGFDGAAVAAHEFSHRVERTTPGIKEAEDAFLTYRAKKSNNGEMPIMQPVLPFATKRAARQERGYVDSFHEPYAGKVYTSGAREILSIGIEQLFFGKFGGFAGQAQDDEYRAFIIGLMARSTIEEKQ